MSTHFQRKLLFLIGKPSVVSHGSGDKETLHYKTLGAVTEMLWEFNGYSSVLWV